ncbi:MAG: adenosylcobalamin-dependent ribonucleoside-diphosphate reductase [bacterium]
MKSYSRNEVFKKSLEYFKRDTLSADVWINKYSLKDSEGNIYELTPNDMHDRIASELNRIENKYPNPLSKEKIFDLIKDFKYIIPQGSPMAGIGNDLQTTSLSNCFVIGNYSDSYGGIMLTDQEQAQLMKRRGGVGHDLSHIRPKGSPVKNSALTSTGVVPFMERFSNTTREVAQDGRRGALMLSISVKHPDAEDFIDAKMTEGKVTGANISVKLTDEFMECVRDKKPFIQQYPIDSDNPVFTKEIDANKLWNKIVYNAWKSAEPGLMFWDNITREAIPDCYKEHGFQTVSTNPCGEIPLNQYDSCRLLAMNLYSYVENPFTENAKFNWELFEEHAVYAQRFMDDIVDLEIEKIDKILEKIKRDPEPNHIKVIEVDLWEKIKEKAIQGRRTGLGITSEGDMLAALGIIYGSDESIELSTKVHKTLAVSAYKSSIIMAKERGSFEVFDFQKEKDNPFVKRILNELSDDYINMWKETGRRNIALLTIAPTGSVSLMSQTTSGIEPVFLPVYTRRRKINPNDKNSKVSFVDEVGDSWEEYNVFHPKFKVWAELNGYNVSDLEKAKPSEIEKIVKLSPYYKSTSNDVDWVSKVKLQGSVQKWVDHSISVTVNLPNEVSEEIVGKVYKTGWEVGCKGITVYRDGSRSGVLISSSKDKKTNVFNENHAPKRPDLLPCDVYRFQNKGEKWIGFMGLLDNRPYEIFTGLQESVNIPNNIITGHILKVKNAETDGKSRYDFVYIDKDGYKQEFRGLSRAFNREYWNTGRLISGILRHGMPIPNVLQLIDKLNFDNEDSISSWKSGVKRTLKKYIKEGTLVKGETCDNCGSTNIIYKEGCMTCMDCQTSKCE